MLPIVTIIGLQVGLLLSGAVLTETVFCLARDRHLALAAIEARDYARPSGRHPRHRGRLRHRQPPRRRPYGFLNPRIRLS